MGEGWYGVSDPGSPQSHSPPLTHTPASSHHLPVFDEELAALQGRIRQVAAAGVDAVIVQDLGAVELVRRVAPGLPIHGSTQMSITSPQGAEFAAQVRGACGCGLGVRVRVLGGAHACMPAAGPLLPALLPSRSAVSPAWWWAASCLCATLARWRRAGAPRSRHLCTAPCASPTPASASRQRRGAAAPPTVASARR